MRVLIGPRRGLTSVAIGPDGEVAACGRGPLHVWRNGHRTTAFAGRSVEVSYTSDGRWLLYRQYSLDTYADTATNGEYALDRRGGQPPYRLTDGYRLAVAADRVLVADFARRGVRCLRVSDAPPFPEVWRREASASGVYYRAALLAGGRLLLASNAHRVGFVVEELDADTGAVRATRPGSLLNFLAACPAGDRLLGHHGPRLRVWAGDQLDSPPVDSPEGWASLTGLVWHPSGTYLLGVEADGGVVRLDPAAGRLTPMFRPPAGKAQALAVAPDGLTAAVATSRGTVVVFDLD